MERSPSTEVGETESKADLSNRIKFIRWVILTGWSSFPHGLGFWSTLSYNNFGLIVSALKVMPSKPWPISCLASCHPTILLSTRPQPPTPMVIPKNCYSQQAQRLHTKCQGSHSLTVALFLQYSNTNSLSIPVFPPTHRSYHLSTLPQPFGVLFPLLTI